MQIKELLIELDHKKDLVAKHLFSLLKSDGDFLRGGYHASVFLDKLTQDTTHTNRWHYYYEVTRNLTYHFICDRKGIIEVDKIFRNGKKEKKIIRSSPTEPIETPKPEITKPTINNPEQLKMF